MVNKLLFSESLYRGLHPVLISLCASGFVYFYAFHGLRAVFADNGRKHSAFKDLVLGALAGQTLI
jgi:adenine nucleotide transporter 17